MPKISFEIDPEGGWRKNRFEFCNALEDAADGKPGAYERLESLGICLAPAEGWLNAVADYLDGMADNAPRHGAVDATSYHKAYEQGVREAARALRMKAEKANG